MLLVGFCINCCQVCCYPIFLEGSLQSLLVIFAENTKAVRVLNNAENGATVHKKYTSLSELIPGKVMQAMIRTTEEDSQGLPCESVTMSHGVSGKGLQPVQRASWQTGWGGEFLMKDILFGFAVTLELACGFSNASFPQEGSSLPWLTF